jgi:hypothetical protein
MNEDPRLIDFLRQNRSIAPPASSELEDSSISTIEPLPLKKKRRIPRKWWRYLEFGIGTIFMSIVGGTIHQLMNPSPPDIAKIHPLDRYLESQWSRVASNPADMNEDNITELEAYLLQTDDDSEDI